MHVVTKRRLLRENRGIIRRVARLIKRDPALVSRVYWGTVTSRRVLEALEAELRQSGDLA